MDERKLLKDMAMQVILMCDKEEHPAKIVRFIGDTIKKLTKAKKKENLKNSPTYPKGEYIVVDAGCRRNPGPTEYRGIKMPSGEEYFSVPPFDGTNNLGEFLAIVHAMAQMEKDGLNLPIYSDSAIAINWVLRKVCKTDWEKYDLWGSKPLADRALQWLKTHKVKIPIKWKTKEWGEIPADYGRK